jgi:hypothetical protein
MQLSHGIDQQIEKVVSEQKKAQERVDERNEMLIRQMCESHNSETRTLRERLAEL